MENARVVPMRPVILGTLVACLVLALAPWMSGGQRPVAMLVSGGALLLAAMLAWRQPEARRLQWGPLALSFALLIGFALASLLWSANRYSTMIWVVQWVMAGLAFLVAYTVAGERQGRGWVLRAYLASAAGFCLIATWMFLTSEYPRLTGTFYWANPAAVYLIPAIILGIDQLRKAAGKLVWFWGGLSGLYLTSFWLTDSRGATLVLMFVTVFYLLLMPTPKQFWIKYVFTLVISFVMAICLSWLSTLIAQKSTNIVPGSRFSEAAQGESSSASDRWFYLGSAFEMWFTHPMGGTGAGTYGDVHPQYQKRVVSASASAHNLYVQVLAELGLIGAAALAAVMLWLFVGSLRGLVANPDMVPVAVAIGGLLIHFGLDIDARYPALLMLAAVLLGLVYRQWGQARGRVSWLWPAVAALLMAPLVSLYQSDVWASRARVAQDDGDYPMAAAMYGAAHSGFVYNPDLVNAEGINLYTIGSSGMPDAKAAAALALERAREGQRLDRYDGQHAQLEGRVLALQGDLTGASAALREALRLDPYNHPEYALDLARLQERMGDTIGAVSTAQQMLWQYPEEVVANRVADETLRPTLANLEAFIGNIHLKEGRIEEAKGAAYRALKLDPENLRGRALMHQVDIR